MKGKNFGNRKPENERPLNDFYQTPKCMTKELLNSQMSIFNEQIKNKIILDPCCGKYAIGNVLRESGIAKYNKLIEKDLIYGSDFLKENYDEKVDVIIMNPPFKLFDDFVKKSKEISNIVCSIGKLTFFGAHKRNIEGLWKHLEYVLIFDRQIAYDKPFRDDGKVECGMLVTGWFIWNKDYEGLPKISMLDIQKYILNKSYNKLEDKND